MERGGSQSVPGQESKEGEEGFHSRKTELPSGQHASCELEQCPAGAVPLWSAFHASPF